jgi:hypothetical protein
MPINVPVLSLAISGPHGIALVLRQTLRAQRRERNLMAILAINLVESGQIWFNRGKC